MNQLEENVLNSFRLAKNDIIQLQSEVIELNQRQKELIETIDHLKALETQLYHSIKEIKQQPKKIETVIKTITKRGHKTYLASKNGKKFHTANCPFGQNIKPKTKIKFNSKAKALNKGLKPCDCVTQ